MQPTLRQLEYLVAVADHLNFRRAAEAVHVSQPALSTQIRQLEEMLGVALFERDRRRVVATDAGVAAAARARHILLRVDELTEAARGFQQPLSGRLRLGVIPSVAPYLLPRVLPGVRERHPKLRLLLREDTTDRVLDQLHDGKLDVVLLALEARLGDVKRHVLFDDPFVLAVHRDHPLAKRKRVTEADLASEPVLLLEDGH